VGVRLVRFHGLGNDYLGGSLDCQHQRGKWNTGQLFLHLVSLDFIR
jgi:hypothetical protein